MALISRFEGHSRQAPDGRLVRDQPIQRRAEQPHIPRQKRIAPPYRRASPLNDAGATLQGHPTAQGAAGVTSRAPHPRRSRRTARTTESRKDDRWYFSPLPLGL